VSELLKSDRICQSYQDAKVRDSLLFFWETMYNNLQFINFLSWLCFNCYASSYHWCNCKRIIV